jgi:hypothetical protein
MSAVTTLENKDTSDSQLDIKDVTEFEWLWRNKGKLPDGTTMELKDALSVPNAPILFPKVVSNIVKEAAEPLLIGTSLLQRINYSYGQTISFPAVGALVAADIAEGQEYPERSLQMGGGTVTASIGKSGVAVRITDEMVRYSQFDVIGLHLRAAGRALARHKEVKIFNFIRKMGVTVFDNLTPTASLKGVTTGRDITGAANGSLTMDDVFDAYAHILTQGFIPNTLLMHPLTWSLFVKDPTLRAFAMANGSGSFLAGWNGQVNQQAPWGNSSQGGMGISPGQNTISGPSTATGGAAASGAAATSAMAPHVQSMTSAPIIPGYWGMTMRIIVSPFVPFDAARKLTDIYMFDSNELGVLIVDEDVTTEEFDDPRVDIRKIKFRERYGIGILNEGQAIGVIRNVHVVPNEVVLPAMATLDVSGTLGKISPTASVL